MKYAGLKNVRWIALALAVIGIIQTPFAVAPAISKAIVDHRLIIPFVGTFAIRILFLGFMLKIWWDTRDNPKNTVAASAPKIQNHG
jgi:hypothetical protein